MKFKKGDLVAIKDELHKGPYTVRVVGKEEKRENIWGVEYTHTGIEIESRDEIKTIDSDELVSYCAGVQHLAKKLKELRQDLISTLK